MIAKTLRPGLEDGCTVLLPHGLRATVELVERNTTNPDSDIVYVKFRGNITSYHEHEIERDPDDTRETRNARFAELLEAFPKGATFEEDPAEHKRFVCVSTLRDHSTAQFHEGGNFEDAVDTAAGEVIDGWLPEGVYDLDTGEKIDIHVSSPVITPSEDQGATVNELDRIQRVESAKWVDENYDHIADEFSISITVPPDRGDEIATLLDTICQATWIEHASVKRSKVRQLRIKESVPEREADLYPDTNAPEPAEEVDR